MLYGLTTQVRNVTGSSNFTKTFSKARVTDDDIFVSEGDRSRSPDHAKLKPKIYYFNLRMDVILDATTRRRHWTHRRQSVSRLSPVTVKLGGRYDPSLVKRFSEWMSVEWQWKCLKNFDLVKNISSGIRQWQCYFRSKSQRSMSKGWLFLPVSVQ